MNSYNPLLKTVTRLAGATAAAGASALVGAALYATAKMNLRSPENAMSAYTFSPFETDIRGYEDVSFTTEDGLRLRGWWLPHPESKRVIIGLAGHRSPKSDLLGIGSGLWRAGNNVLLFDWRSRGESDRGQHSLAYYELRDAEAALNYARQRLPDAELGLVGYSMGASIAVLLAARTPDIRAVVADSPFTGISEVVSYGVSRFRVPAVPARVIVSLADALTGWRYGYRFGAVRPIEAVAAISPRPLMLIHGDADSLIPVEHAHELFAQAHEPKLLWIVPDVEHCGAYFADRAGYVARVVAFFDQYLGSIEGRR